mgnify:CR=1 FL=1
MLDGASRLDELVGKAAAEGMPALGMTDHGNMYGVVDFYKQCKEKGIKPIIGTEAYMAHEHRSERPSRRGRIDDSGGETESGGKVYYHLTLLAENNIGYKNLIKLSSLAFLEGYYYQPRMDWELLQRHSKGIIATSGCLGGHVLQKMLKGDISGAETDAGRLQDIFGKDNLFVELQDHGIANQRTTNPKLVEIARAIGAPIIATNDSHYVNQSDHMAHDALLCVQTGALMRDQDRFRFEGNEHYLKTAAEMRSVWKDLPEACDNTLLIAERAQVDITFDEYQIPDFPIPADYKTPADYLSFLTWKGAQQRWGDNLPSAVVERLAFELKTISDMGFDAYFLIVWDLIRHARESNIRVGPGRGSAAGCAVAYCLRITDLDPLKYDLLFERFLNPSRISMPDIDMDFDSRYRDHMIQYAADKYGRDHVAQIITFATIKARNAVRDAARVLGHEYGVGDRIAKLMPALQQGRDTPLAACFEYSDEHAAGYREAQGLRDLVLADDIAAKVVEVARGLEGLKRSDGIHAAAVVITGKPLMDYLPIQRKGNDAPIVTQYEMHAVESLGLLKMDFLGLRNLDVIADAVDMIREQTDPDFDIDIISLEDPETFELLGRGDTIGVFQLESLPMQSLLRLMRPTVFEDVCAVIALYRPGPMSTKMHTTYAKIKNNIEEPEYFHEDAREVLHDTYGLMVYQESMMRVAQKFAGYSLAQADNLRKACGKKDPKAMAAEEGSFVDGCEKTGYGRPLGEKLFGIIRGFADYAFNKSHSFGYGHICYQTAFLKANYPMQYFAALLTSVKDNLEKAAGYLVDARNSGITLGPPNINVSEVDFTPLVTERVIYFGLSAIKGIGQAICERIVSERALNGPFASFHDFAMRVPSDCLNKKSIESFIKAGAFDGLGHPRQGLMAIYESIISDSLARRSDADQGVMSLFDVFDSEPGEKVNLDIPIPDMEFEKSVKLKFEKEVLGLYISDHPLFGLEGMLRKHATSTTSGLEDLDSGAIVTLAGIITKVERKVTKKGSALAIIQLEDLYGSVELTVFSKTLLTHGHKIVEDGLVAVKCRYERNDERISIQSLEFTPLTISHRQEELRLNLPAVALDPETVARLKGILSSYPGSSYVFLHIGDAKILKLGEEFLVDIDRVIPPLRVAFGASVIL